MGSAQSIYIVSVNYVKSLWNSRVLLLADAANHDDDIAVDCVHDEHLQYNR